MLNLDKMYNYLYQNILPIYFFLNYIDLRKARPIIIE